MAIIDDTSDDQAWKDYIERVRNYLDITIIEMDDDTKE